jgi:phage-related protein
MSSGSYIAKAYVQITPSMEGAQSTITKALNVESVGTSSGKTLGSSLASNLVKTFTSVVSVAAVAKYTKKLVSTVVENTSEFEQLSGSIEKIFDNMDTSVIMEDANNAYKTLNLSANDYLDTITSIGGAFSTTMGDEEGYNTAKKGLQAIADYASGTGDSVSELSEKYKLITRSTSSYQSIADQFSKIGLPQTKEAFLETAQSAGYLSDEYTSLTDVPLAEYQQAVTNVIYDCIDSMNLIGNTAEESANTMSGSINATKASWENFTTALGTNDVDMLASSMDGLTESIFGTEEAGTGLISNFLEIVGNLFTNLSSIISKKMQTVIDNLPDTLSNLRTKAEEFIKNDLDDVVDNIISYMNNNADMSVKLIDAISDAISDALDDLSNDPELASKMVSAFVKLTVTLYKNKQKISNALLGALIDIVSTALQDLPDYLTSDWLGGFFSGLGEDCASFFSTSFTSSNGFGEDGILGKFNKLTDSIVTYWVEMHTNVWNLLKDAVDAWKEVLSPLTNWFSNLWNTIKTEIETVWNGINTFLNTIFTAIYTLVQTIFNPIREFFTVMWNNVKVVTTTVWEVLSTWLAYIFNVIKTKVEAVFNPIKTFIVNTFNSIKTTVTTIWNTISSTIGTIINNIKTKITNVFNSVKSFVSSIWNSIKTAISGPLESAKSTVSNIVNSISSTVTNVFNSLKSTVSSIWNSIKTAITSPIESAKTTISNAISSIKSIFSGTHLKLDIKLPHISVSGGVSPYGIGGKGSLPKFSVSWYNKGYDEAQILRSATIFGVTNGGQLLGGGESGNEVVVGEQHLLDMIAKTQRENSVGGTIVINVYGAEGQSEEKIADRVIDKLSRMTTNRRVVYA